MVRETELFDMPEHNVQMADEEFEPVEETEELFEGLDSSDY